MHASEMVERSFQLGGPVLALCRRVGEAAREPVEVPLPEVPQHLLVRARATGPEPDRAFDPMVRGRLPAGPPPVGEPAFVQAQPVDQPPGSARMRLPGHFLRWKIEHERDLHVFQRIGSREEFTEHIRFEKERRVRPASGQVVACGGEFPQSLGGSGVSHAFRDASARGVAGPGSWWAARLRRRVLPVVECGLA